MTGWITDTPPNRRFPLLTRANASEVAPSPLTPIAWSVLWQRGCVPGVVDAMIERGLFRESDRTDLRSIFSCVGGYLYLNLSVIRIQGARTPGATVEDVERHLIGDQSGATPYVPEPGDNDPELEALVAQRIGELLMAEHAPGVAENRDAATAARRQRPELSSLDDPALISRARQCADVVRQCFRSYTVITAGSAMGAGILAKSLSVLGAEAPSPVVLLGGIGEVESTGSVYALWNLSRSVRHSGHLTEVFDADIGHIKMMISDTLSQNSDVGEFARAFEQFRSDYGYKGSAEWDPGAHSWGTDDTLVIRMIDRLRQQDDSAAPSVRANSVGAIAEQERARTERLLADHGEALGEYQFGLNVSRKFLAARESLKLSMSMLVHEIRLALLELAHRHGIEFSHVAMLTDEELEQFVKDPTSKREDLASRRLRFDKLSEFEPPFFIDGNAPPLDTWPRRTLADVSSSDADAGPLQGVPVSAGVARGRVRVVSDPSDVELDFGDVLVARATDPSWMPLLTLAGAVVVETGSLISHAVIVSRELGLPCVVGIDGATRLLPDGALVEVDGTTGVISLIS